MKKNILPVISDEMCARIWHRQLVVASSVASVGGVLMMTLLILILSPGILGNVMLVCFLLIGAAAIALSTSLGGWYVATNVVEGMRSRLQSVRQFLQEAGHELATPVSILRSRIQVMERQSSERESENNDLEVLSDSTRRLSVLIDDMRTLARAEAPRSATNLSLINLGELVRSVAAQMKDACDLRAMEITLQIGTPATIIGEHEAIERMVSNLLSNAIRYGRNGGKVSVNIKPEKDRLFLTVEDDGVGISPEALPKVFDRFYRAAPDKEAQSTSSGLGLAIVKAIVEGHSGQIDVESNPGANTRFTVELPKTPVHPLVRMMNSKT